MVNGNRAVAERAEVGAARSRPSGSWDGGRHLTTPVTPRIRLAIGADAPLLAELRYEFRTALAPEVEPETGFRERCAAWMAARLSESAAWRCWLAESEAVSFAVELDERVVGFIQFSEEEGYLLELVRYLHLNPLRAKMVPLVETEGTQSVICFGDLRLAAIAFKDLARLFFRIHSPTTLKIGRH